VTAGGPRLALIAVLVAAIAFLPEGCGNRGEPAAARPELTVVAAAPR
jgi:hypothetical protein